MEAISPACWSPLRTGRPDTTMSCVQVGEREEGRRGGGEEGRGGGGEELVKLIPLAEFRDMIVEPYTCNASVNHISLKELVA